ncbi:MAG: MerR family transcriptional regulator [Actinobacteria bacterium]|nr:MerR family transcriptional regulator [Actinomycetota bacterium]
MSTAALQVRVDEPGYTRTVADVAAESGVAASAIRFYERHGLIQARRTTGNQRRFDEDAACRVKVARVAQRIGMRLVEIKDLLDSLPPDADLIEWQRVHRVLVEEGQRRIAELNAALDDITSGRKLCEL